jgi:L-threonylcarbamoyladenylate synthase
MSEIILYPTETVYALGVNPFDREAWDALCELKGRHGDQTASWLVPSIEDIAFYAEVTPEAKKLIEQYMPGPFTIVLKANSFIPRSMQALDGTVSFRVSSDPVAQQMIEDYMAINNVPLTCTSANVHGQPTMITPQIIAEQFGDKVHMITKIIDDGPRLGTPSTIVRCVDDTVSVLRQGSITLGEAPITIGANHVSSTRGERILSSGMSR